MMGHNPHPDVKVKPTVRLWRAVAHYLTESTSKGVCSVSRPARTLHYNRGTKGRPLNLMTAERIAGNQHWCDRCMLFFSSRYNLDRHKRRNNPCRFNVNSTTPRKVIDVLTGELRYRTPDEQRELECKRKFKNYWDIR